MPICFVCVEHSEYVFTIGAIEKKHIKSKKKSIVRGSNTFCQNKQEKQSPQNSKFENLIGKVL